MIWPKPGKPASSREVSNNVNPRDIDLPGRRLTVGWLRNQVSFREFGAWVNSMLRRQRQYPRMAKYLRRGNRAGPCRSIRHRSRPTMRVVQPKSAFVLQHVQAGVPIRDVHQPIGGDQDIGGFRCQCDIWARIDQLLGSRRYPVGNLFWREWVLDIEYADASNVIG